MLLLVLLTLVAEVAVLIAVGQAVGALATVGLLLVISMAGMLLLRKQGARTLASFTDALRARRDPQPEMVDGMLIGVAGALVVFPGFVTDVLALFLLFPPTRKLVRQRVVRRAQQRSHREEPVLVVDSVIVEDDRP